MRLRAQVFRIRMMVSRRGSAVVPIALFLLGIPSVDDVNPGVPLKGSIRIPLKGSDYGIYRGW